MDGEWQLLLKISASLSIGWISILIGAFWKVLHLIRGVEAKMKDGDDQLHSRVNRVREETVHKGDMNELATRLSGDMRDMRQEQRDANKATNDRLDALLAAIANRNGGHEK